MKDILATIWEYLTVYGLRVIAAIVIFIIGRLVSRLLARMVKKLLTNKGVDAAVVSFLSNLTFFLLVTFVVLAALGQLGIQTTSFVAVIGAAGLAIGLALQGALSNFAAGFLMIIFRPIKSGDYIEGAGVAGIVEKIQIFTTQLRTPDNKTIIIPNSKLTSDNIVNYSTKETRRVDLVFGIGYGDDIDKARRVINGVLAKDGRILEDPAPTVTVISLGDSSVDFAVRPWVKIADYWDVYFSVTENVKKGFDSEGISIPFPQRDVHIYEHKDPV